MKKIVCLFVLAFAISFVHAQDNKGSESTPKSTVKPTTVQNNKVVLKVEEIPEGVVKDINTTYPQGKIMAAFKFNNNPSVMYEVAIKSDSNKVFQYYDKDGKFLRKKVTALRVTPKPIPQKTEVQKTEAPKK